MNNCNLIGKRKIQLCKYEREIARIFFSCFQSEIQVISLGSLPDPTREPLELNGTFPVILSINCSSLSPFTHKETENVNLVLKGGEKSIPWFIILSVITSQRSESGKGPWRRKHTCVPLDSIEVCG